MVAIPQQITSEESDVARVKLAASVLLFAATMLCGYLPVRTIVSRRLIQHAMFAGGGVLLATAFCHLIPEAHDGFKHKPAGGVPRRLPLTEITLCAGFIFMYALEQLMLKFVYSHAHDHPLDVRDVPQQQRQQQVSTTLGQVGHLTPGAGTGTNTIRQQQSVPAGQLYRFARGLLIVSAFSVHSIFDGVAIGSQESARKVWAVFAAICCHKLIIAAVVGLELYAAMLKSHLWTLVHLAIFSAMSPLGIVLVVLAENAIDPHANHSLMILLQSFATGTLLYIIFIEILQPKEEHWQTKNRVWKCLSLVVGFVLMLAVLTLIDDDGHDDHHN